MAKHAVVQERRRRRLAEQAQQPVWLLYHRTEAGSTIMREGFRDGTGSYLTRHEFTGVWLSDEPLTAKEGTSGEDLIEMEAPLVDFEGFEWVEQGKPYREWLIPAAVVNCWPRRLLNAEEEEHIENRDWDEAEEEI